MKKQLLFILPAVVAFAGCSANDASDLLNEVSKMQDFNFADYSVDAIEDVLGNLQDAGGYKINFTNKFFADINDSTNVVETKVEVGGKGNITWVYSTTNNVKVGYALKVEGEVFTGYQFENNAWRKCGSTDLSVPEIREQISSEVEELILDNDYMSKINFESASKESKFLSSRECYVFKYSGSDYIIEIDVDKVLGVALYYSVQVIDNVHRRVSRDLVEVNNISISNVVAPKIE